MQLSVALDRNKQRNYCFRQVEGSAHRKVQFLQHSALVDTELRHFSIIGKADLHELDQETHLAAGQHLLSTSNDMTYII